MTTGPGEGGAGVGVGPSVAAIGGPVDLVGPVGEAPAHLRPCRRCRRRRGQVAGDLDIADEARRLNCRSLVQVSPLSVEQRTKATSDQRSRSRKRTSDHRRERLGCCRPSQTLGRRSCRCERRNGSSYRDPREWWTYIRPGPDRRRPASSQTVNQVPVGRLYRTTGSPKVLAKGL